jgi:amino acid adenylation domain-containing protein
MDNVSKEVRKVSSRQQAIRAKCFHPSGKFVAFEKREIEQSIPDRFEKIVRLGSDRLAIKTEKGAFTYDEVNKTANRIARTILDSQGEGNKPVAILMEHGAQALATILGALKAGKIYVPLEPSHPLERLRYILRDTEAELILTDDINLPLAHEVAAPAVPVINTSEIKSDVATHNVSLTISPGAFAYILYTSGSTGQPKGVVENHRNVLHGTLRVTNGLHICPEDRLLFTESASSSNSVRRIFPALLTGASLFPFDVKRRGLDGLVNFVAQENITYMGLGRMRDFVGTLNGNQAFKSLRLVGFGGDIVRTKEIEICKKVFPPHCLIGVWMSCTETGNVTQFLIDQETKILGDIVPIGYPADDMRILLLDYAGKPVGDGEMGEIAVQSRYLSVGYWRRPDLTDAKFITEPTGGDERIYLTGDLGRIDADGCLFHLGRKDDQVKVRGYRIETAEIETALLNLGMIRKAFVTSLEREAPDRLLVAYLVPERWPAPTASALRRALADLLPTPMIPSIFVMLDAFPVTPTGKVDRQALPDPGNSRPELDTAYVAPTTPIEEQLANIWAEVLAIDQVGVRDNFFDLGGHSLLATRVIARVIKTFRLELPSKALFESPTVADMAIVVTQNQARAVGEEDLDRMLRELETISEAEAQQLIGLERDHGRRT